MRETKPNSSIFSEHGLIENATYGVLLIGEKTAHVSEGIKSALRGGGMEKCIG